MARAAMDSDAALVLATIRSDSYNVMQTAKALAGIHQHTFSLGPVPGGEVANIIREPAKLLRRKVGPIAPEFDDAVVSQLQDEVAGEADALPLLAFVLERLMRENAAKPVIGINELDQTGGIADAIKAAAEAALNDAGIRQDDVARRNILRRLFIPALARIEPKTRVVQRRTARLDTLDSDLVALAKSLTARRLLVTRKTAGEFASTVTVEVAHEALLRRWTVLDALLAEDRDALMLLDATLVAADDWTKAQSTNKRDFIVHHGSRLADARALASRGAGWARDIAAADDYLSACSMAERTRLEKEARAAKWLKRWAAAASVLVVLASVATWWAWDNSQGILVRNHEIARQSAALESASEAAILAKQQAEQARDTAVDEAKKAQLAKELASKNLQDAMRTESLFRAQQAQAALKSGDAVTSMILALDGLPDASSETEIRRNRPWVIEAEAALRAALRSQKERQVFVGHTGPVTSLAYISDDRIVTGSKDETARLWDVASGKELMQFRGHSDEITSVTVMSDERIVTGSRDATVRIWNTSTGMEFLRIDNNDESVTSVAISPKGQIIVGSQRGYVRLWDSKTGEMISEIAAGAGGVTAVAVTEDGDIVTGHSNGTTSVWSAESGKRILQLKHDDYELPVTCLAITIDGYIVVGSYDGVARQWSRSTGDKIAEFRGHRGPIRSIAASSNGSRIVTGADDQTARVWQADSAVALEQFVGHVAPVLAVTF
ncbi:MAG TPA: WD40 repeat domain-containing protein, partial [Candidatus Hydrogenedentes bacterium]|nr:WD40 repeat domain-containing protein [Candidatus Hydrogenedentota bacterium]